MRTQKFQMLSSVLLALAAVAVSAGPSWAGPPETPRTFAELTDPSLPCADWEAEESKRVVAHRDGGPADVIEFITPGGPGNPWTDEDAIVRDGDGNVIIDLRSTKWVRTPVLHVTEFGAEEIRHAYWLEEDLDGDGDLDPAAPGMTAPTGLDGVVMNLVTIRIQRIGPSDSYNANKFYVTSAGDAKFCIAVGLFQK